MTFRCSQKQEESHQLISTTCNTTCQNNTLKKRDKKERTAVLYWGMDFFPSWNHTTKASPAYINHLELVQSIYRHSVLTESVTLPHRHLCSSRPGLLCCLIQSAAQTPVLSVLASGFCSVLVLLTQTSWQVFTFCSCFSLYPCFPSSSSSLCVCVCFGSNVTPTLPTLSKNGPSVCRMVYRILVVALLYPRRKHWMM